MKESRHRLEEDEPNTRPSPTPTAHTDTVFDAVRELALVCPQCKQPLGASASVYICDPCDREFPVISGIPDLRIVGDPFLGFDEDYARTNIVLERIEELGLRDLLEHYWSFSDITPPRLRREFVESAMRGESRAERTLSAWQAIDGADLSRARCLEIGSGTGNLLLAAARRGIRVVGTDIAMRWLHLSRRRFVDAGLAIPALVCCSAEHLPFSDASFDANFALSTLEFVRDAEQSLSEVARILSSTGTAYACSVNRYSIAVNPYADLWGIGWLPRSLHARYAFFRRGAAFSNVHLLSQAELRRYARPHFQRVQFELADVSDETLAGLPLSSRIQIGIYRVLKRTPLVRDILMQVGPEWDILFQKGK